MLTIEFDEICEEVECGTLFNQIGFLSSIEPSDVDGDTFISDEWGIEILSADAYYPIEGYRWTKPEIMVRLSHRTSEDFVSEDCIPVLDCSPDHVILTKDRGWQKVKDLSCGEFIITKHGFRIVCDVENLEKIERLCDLQVSIAHSYFAENVLSHNSHFLVALGSNALKAGVDVVHYTLELSETAVGMRYDSNLCDIDSNLVIDEKDQILDKYKSMKLGRLMIKEFPMNTATIYNLKSHIERLDLKGFRPGLIIIDYADIMRSTRQYDSLRHELKLIYEELRGFASEKKIPIWSASQSNKEGSTADVVDLNNMSEAYGKAMVCDVVLSISRKAHEKSGGWGRLYVAKNRAGRDGLVYPVKIDTARSKFEIVGGAGTFEEAKSDDENATKKALRTKFNELKNDPAFHVRMSGVTSNAESEDKDK